MHAPPNTKKSIVTQELALALLIIIAAAIYSYNLRTPYINTLSNGRHQWLTASTLKFTKAWMEDGFWNDRGVMLQYPSSIERATPKDRVPYLSYLPGAPVEIFMIKQVLPDVPLLKIIHIFNMVNQLCIAIIAAVIVYCGASAKSASFRGVFAAIAGVTYLLHPSTMYWHSMVFFSDQAVMLPYALILFFELRIRQSNGRERSDILTLQSLMFAIGTFIDWFTVTLAGVVFLFRLWRPLPGTRGIGMAIGALFQTAIGPAIAIGVWCYQVYSLDAFGVVLDKFLVRSNSTEGFHPLGSFREIFIDRFINGHISKMDTVVILTCLAYTLYECIRNRQNHAANVTLIALSACLLHTYIFTQHALEHSFSVLKLYLPLAFGAYALTPMWVIERVGNTRLMATHPRIRENVLFLLVIACVAGWGVLNYPHHHGWRAGFPTPRIVHQEMGFWIVHNVDKNTLLVSNDFILPMEPPQIMAVANHGMYRPDSVEALNTLIGSVPKGASFLGIIAASRKADCVSGEHNIRTVRSEGQEWLVIPFTAASSDMLKKCLVRSGH